MVTSGPEGPHPAGLLLAAGAGTRMGTPKALVRSEGGEPWVVRGARALLEAGCSPVVVVLGAGADEARALLETGGLSQTVEVVVADDWQHGMGHSLRAGLERLRSLPPEEALGALVMLVDLPDVDVAVLRRVAQAWVSQAEPRAALVRATYEGEPGHPVVLGRDHWEALVETLHGDVGAQAYLSGVDIRRRVETVECADLATGRDRDRPDPDRS